MEYSENSFYHVLIVDDLDDNRTLLRLDLEDELPGIIIDEANNGTEAIAKIRQNDYTLVLCDLMMPDIDGFEVYKRVKEDPKLFNLPFIFISANQDHSMAVKGLELGAFDFLKKPYDITELILKSRNLCRLKLFYNRQLELLTHLDDANKKLEKANKQKDEVLRIVSHDMRNPLGNIIGLAQILFEEPSQVPNDIQNIAEIIIRSGENLLTIVNTLLDVARLEAGKITIDYTQVDLNTLIEHEIKQFNIAARQKDIQLRYVSEIKNESFTLDEAKIRQAVANLISNAIKFTPEKGTVTVSLTKSETELCIKIKDNGIGIAEADIPYLFDKFSIVQRHGTKNELGTGLGLSIVKAFVSLHKGTVTVESEKDKGTEFTIRIPLF